MNKCAKCKKLLDDYDAYEYRGAYSCAEHFDEVITARDHQRMEIIAEEDRKLSPLKGMDIDPDNAIGRANKQILKAQIEIAGKESSRLREYEGRL
jgi:recombinational DNA repair protein (RecF pathway)